MATIAVRTLIIYLFLSLSVRIMGKRQIGELDAGDLVSALLISEIAAIPIDDPDIPVLNALIPMLIIISLEIIVSSLKNKSEKLKRAIEGEPEYVIYRGKILQGALSENRISINELLSEMRSQGVGNISEVSYAIIEPSGTLSLIKKDEGELLHSLIIDGEVIEKNLHILSLSEGWLDSELEKRKLAREDVFLFSVSDDGKTNIILKEGKNA